MSAGITPIFPIVPYAASASLAAVTACTTRAPTATASLAGANIFALTTTQTNGVRIDAITIKACSTAFTSATVAQTVTIWLHDGTTAWPIDEILITAVTPSTTAASFTTTRLYNNMILPSTHSLYMSTSVTTTASTTALAVTAQGGAY